LEHRNATAAVIGAGDYIGAAIARKFAGEGFLVFAGRRRGEKLAPLVADIEAAGGRARRLRLPDRFRRGRDLLWQGSAARCRGDDPGTT
jgi:NAD(P)-dependent dehydrogenase (short-subunit alcohol dehydrogenase family)